MSCLEFQLGSESISTEEAVSHTEELFKGDTIWKGNFFFHVCINEIIYHELIVGKGFFFFKVISLAVFFPDIASVCHYGYYCGDA